MSNRCPKCDSDRFQSHKGELTIVYTDKDGQDTKSPQEDGMAFVLCAWCKNRVLFVDPAKESAGSKPASTH